MFASEQQHLYVKWLMIIIAIFLFIIILIFGVCLGIEKAYADKIYPNIYINDIPVGNLSIDEANGLIYGKIDNLSMNGINFVFGEKTVNIMPTLPSTGSDLALPLITFDADKTLNEAGSYGHTSKISTNVGQFIRSLFIKQNLHIPVTVNDNEIKSSLEFNFKDLHQPAQNARLAFTQNLNKTFSFTVQKEVTGKILNFEKGLAALKKNLETLNNDAIRLEETIDTPLILSANADGAEKQAADLLTLAPLVLVYNDKSWTIKPEIFVGWLALKSSGNNPGENVDVGLSNETVINYLNDKIANELNIEPADAKFQMKDGRITEFLGSRDGIKINPQKSFTAIEEAIALGTSTAVLIVEEYKSAIKTENVNDLGIKEIIGTGQSNFAGSPKNRRHNINVGANSLNGVLIKPNEEFSLIKNLGKIDGSTGYLPELVIKDNKTTPEFGGGLCQIGTTMFRGALESGLPITQRRNHSYRVQYYEPAGTDATIYDPAPDFRFINDTGNYILIQSRIEGNNIYFDFWGTKDGRLVEKTKPTVTKIVKPGPTKIIETLDLKPGEKKCTEKAHNGADASFYYKVTYPNGDIKDKTFNSHYVPWREVCLLGVEKLSTDTAPATATSTEPNTQTTEIKNPL